MNSITICGNVAKPEMRYLNSGDAVLQFSVADNQGKDKQPIWWRCALFGKRAESLQSFIQSGAKVTVVGSVSEREFTDKNGQERKAMEIRVNDIALQGGKAEAEEKPARQAKPAMAPDDSEDLPF
jgi:single-strand DNA-binding protein